MRNLLFAAAFLGLAGCYKVEVTNLADGPVGLEHTKKAHTLIGGLVALNDINAATVCGDKGALKVTTVHSFVDLVLATVTASIYTPVTVKIVCKG
jgi:hypothetical protein